MPSAGSVPQPHARRYALAKGNIVHLLATESTGALSPDVIRLLRELAKTAQGTSGHDSTVYGLSRASPKSFFPHHLAAISWPLLSVPTRALSVTTLRPKRLSSPTG